MAGIPRVVVIALCVVSALAFALVLLMTAGSLRPGDQPSIRGSVVGIVASLAGIVPVAARRPRIARWTLTLGLVLTLAVAALPADGVPPGRGILDLSTWLVPLALAAALSWGLR